MKLIYFNSTVIQRWLLHSGSLTKTSQLDALGCPSQTSLVKDNRFLWGWKRFQNARENQTYSFSHPGLGIFLSLESIVQLICAYTPDILI